MDEAPTADMTSKPRRPTPPRPTHYKVVCISMYTRDIDELEAKVDELKRRGWTKANKSMLIRLALAQLDVATMPIPRGDDGSAASAELSASLPRDAAERISPRERKKLRLRSLTSDETRSVVTRNPALAKLLSDVA